MTLLSLLAGLILLLMLVTIGIKGWLASRDARDFLEDDPSTPPCPPEFVSNVFSEREWMFVQQVRCKSASALFRQERRRIALIWVAETSATIRGIMRKHVLAARHSTNLRISVELKIFLQYASLLLTCSAMYGAIQMMYPWRLSALAQLAQGISARLAEEHRAFQDAMQANSPAVANPQA